MEVKNISSSNLQKGYFEQKVLRRATKYTLFPELRWRQQACAKNVIALKILMSAPKQLGKPENFQR